jgi:hypothetical protein
MKYLVVLVFHEAQERHLPAIFSGYPVVCCLYRQALYESLQACFALLPKPWPWLLSVIRPPGALDRFTG